jgi:hypothetical protein
VAIKHTLVAGLTAFALLIAPVGLSVQWNERGPALSTAPAISTAFAAPSRPTPKKPPANGGPTITSGGTASRTTGFQTRAGGISDELCQAYADEIDETAEYADIAAAGGDPGAAIFWTQQAQAAESEGMDMGCAFMY